MPIKINDECSVERLEDVCLKTHNEPFLNMICDNFLEIDFVTKIEEDFNKYPDTDWLKYDNPVELKQTLNNWNSFHPSHYQLFQALCSTAFTKWLSAKTNVNLVPDHGLHGGGLHLHKGGGKLNPHLDYALHPKSGMARKFNLLIYVSAEMDTDNAGGNLGFWSNDPLTNSPSSLVKTIKPKFNRMVIFDTSGYAWHGLIEPVRRDLTRKSIAMYYLASPNNAVRKNTRASFHANEEQRSSNEIMKIIKDRSSEKNHKSAYVTK